MQKQDVDMTEAVDRGRAIFARLQISGGNTGGSVERAVSIERKSGEEVQMKRKVLIFSEDAVMAEGSYKSESRAKKHRKSDPYQDITSLWVRLSQNHCYEELHQTIINFRLTDEKMADFFSQKGSYLLMCSILYWSDSYSLAFICDNIPKKVLLLALRRDKYAALQALLLGETSLEKKGQVSNKMLVQRSEKIKLLLTVDFEGLKAYMDSEYFKTRYAPGVQASFREAVEEYEFKANARSTNANILKI